MTKAAAIYVAERLPERVRVDAPGERLPVGGDLEYADELTLGRAFRRSPRPAPRGGVTMTTAAATRRRGP